MCCGAVSTLLCSYADESEAFDREWRHRTGAGRHGRPTQGLPQAGGRTYRALPPTPVEGEQPRDNPSSSKATVSPHRHRRRQRPPSLSAEESEAIRRQEGEGKHLHFDMRPQYHGPSSERKAKERKEHHRHVNERWQTEGSYK